MKLETVSKCLFVAALLWLLAGVACAWSVLAADGYEQTARVQYHHNYDTRNIQTVSLHFGPEGGTVTVLGDADLPLMKVLAKVGTNRARVSVTLIRPDAILR